MRSTGSNNFEKMCYMEFGVNTKYVLGLPLATQIGLEHDKKKPKDYDNQPADPAPPPVGPRSKIQWGFFKTFSNKVQFLKKNQEIPSKIPVLPKRQKMVFFLEIFLAFFRHHTLLGTEVFCVAFSASRGFFLSYQKQFLNNFSIFSSEKF